MSLGRPPIIECSSSSSSSEQVRTRVLERRGRSRRRDGPRSVGPQEGGDHAAAVGDKKSPHEVSIQTISLEDFVKYEKAIKDSYSVEWNSSHNPDKGLGLRLIYRHSDGSVLVDGLIPSRDGSPSPAQLSGVIRPGDAMLFVNGVELAALDLFNLTELLKGLDQIAEKGQLNLVFRCGKGNGDPPPPPFKEADSAEGSENCFLGIADPSLPPAASAATVTTPDAYVIPQLNKDREMLPSSPLHAASRQQQHHHHHHLYPVAARMSLVGGLQHHHCKEEELFLKELSEQVFEARSMHLLRHSCYQGFFFSFVRNREEEEEEVGFVFSPLLLLSPPSNTSTTVAQREAQPTPCSIHTYVVMAGVRGFYGSLPRDTDFELINPSSSSSSSQPGRIVASRLDALQVAVMAAAAVPPPRCDYTYCRSRECHSLEHHLVSREASGVPMLLSRLNAKSLLQLLTMQAARCCSHSQIISAAPPLLLTYRIYYSLMAMQNMIIQSSSTVIDLLELWQSTFEANSSSSSVPHKEEGEGEEEEDPSSRSPFQRVVSDLLTLHFCLTVSKACHLAPPTLTLRGQGPGLVALNTHRCSRRRRRRRRVSSRCCSMNYFHVGIDYSSSSSSTHPGGSSSWPHHVQASWPHHVQASGVVADSDSSPTAMKEEEEVAIRYIRKHRALLNLDFVWAFCGAKGYVSAAREVLLLVSACCCCRTRSLLLDPLLGVGHGSGVGGVSVRLDCLIERVEATTGRSRVVLCALMLRMGSILDSNRQLGVQLLLYLFPHVGPQTARMEIFRSRDDDETGGARDDDDATLRDAGDGAVDPYSSRSDDDDDDARLSALEAFHDYATGLLHNRAVVEDDAATGSSYSYVSLQLLWVEASLMLGQYHRQHLHQSISIGHSRRVLDLLLSNPVSALQHSWAATTAQLCQQYGFFEGVAAITSRWLGAILSPGGMQCQQQQESAECDAVSRFEHAIVTMHVLTRKSHHYCIDDAVAHYRSLQSQVQAMLESMQRCISFLLSKLVFDLEEAGSAPNSSYARQQLHAVDPLGSYGSLHCEDQQQLVQLLRLCWKVSIVSAAVDSCSVDGCFSCGGSREVVVLVEIALKAMIALEANTPAAISRLGDDTLPPSIVRRAFDSIRLSAATRFRAYVVLELLVLKGRPDREVGGSGGGGGTVCVAAVIVELLGRSVGVETTLDVIESEPALSRCLDYSMIERLRF